MKKEYQNLTETFTASLIGLRKKDGRYVLIFVLLDSHTAKHIAIDIHDTIHEILGTTNLNPNFKATLCLNLPRTFKLILKDNNWKIQNEYQILSYAISKSL